jgi:alginate O-acetyltransferase complex protein AlgJ
MARPPDLPDRIVSVVFVVALVLPGIALAAGVRPIDLEERPAASLPPIDAGSLGEPSTYAAIDRWIADRFPAKNQAVGAHAAIDYGVLGGSTTPDVIVGRDGWLFTRTELEPTCTFTPEQVLTALDRVAGELAASGVDVRLIVPPDKHTIYPEKVVPGSGLGEACTDQNKAAMQAGMRARPEHAIELWSRLVDAHAASPTTPLYFRQDTHWTPLGALFATRALVESLAPGVWDEAQMPIEGTATYDTDLSRVMGLPAKERVPKLVVRPGVAVERTTVTTTVDLKSARDIGHYKVDSAAAAVEGRTLVIYDSYFRTNERRIAPWFRDSVWVHANDLERSPELAANLGRFDHVVIERVERSAYDVDLEALLASVIAANR